jgi:hypothetical protein
MDGAQGVAEPAPRDRPHDNERDEREYEEVVVEARLTWIGGGCLSADRRDRDTSVSPRDVGQVDYDLTRAFGYSEGRDREVVTSQTKNGQSDEGREGDADHGGDDEGRPEAPISLRHECGYRVAAKSKEDDVAEACVAGETTDDVPREGKRRKHQHSGKRALEARHEEDGDGSKEEQRRCSGCNCNPPRRGSPADAGPFSHLQLGFRRRSGHQASPRAS